MRVRHRDRAAGFIIGEIPRIRHPAHPDPLSICYRGGVDLFEEQHRRAADAVAPLAARMRPRSLEEFAGQEHFLGEDQLLRRLLLADRLGSAIFYGPPGTGKTTLAHIIARQSRAAFVELNAAAAGVKEVRAVLADAQARLASTGQRTILFVDEIHRFNKGQQDVLLSDVENGLIVFIGATTENPFFTVNSPLVSRSHLFRFEPLTVDQVVTLLQRAVADTDRGLGRHGLVLSSEAAHYLAVKSDGDARRALGALEVAALSQLSFGQAAGPVIDLPAAEQSMQSKAMRYDAGGDDHYDAASALIKSMRGSDPHAAVYWLARMLESGEDPRFIARRVAICAAEDIGNADPMALLVASAAFQVTVQVGLPECQLVLAQAVTYLATAPKSNAAAQAIWSASQDVREGRTIPVPKHLQSSAYPGAARLGRGEGYQYPHDSDKGFVEQDYLGVDKQYYLPTDRGHEKVIRAYLDGLKRPPPDPTGE
jgi:putative ATPase